MRRRNRRPRKSSFARTAWALVALTLAVQVGAPYLVRASRRTDVRAAAAGLVALALFALYRRARRWLLVRQRIRAAAVSDRRRDYVFDAVDYRRGNAKESAYRRTMKLTLLAIFNNACAKCGRQDDGVDLDHFFWPKRDGGCFIMRHADGHLVNNAVPLCMHCNRSKADRDYRRFFRRGQLPIILEKNAAMTRLLNERRPVDHRGEAKARVTRTRSA